MGLRHLRERDSLKGALCTLASAALCMASAALCPRVDASCRRVSELSHNFWRGLVRSGHGLNSRRTGSFSRIGLNRRGWRTIAIRQLQTWALAFYKCFYFLLLRKENNVYTR